MLRTRTDENEARDFLHRYRKLPPHELSALEAWSTTFYPFQREWLFETARAAIGCKSRQIGWSHTTGANADLWSGFHGELTTIISIGKRESREVLEKCAAHARVLQRLGSKMLKMVASSKDEITFASGGKIIALPSDGGRSFSGNVILDEFGYAKHAPALWDAAVAVTALSNYKLRVLSTPSGMGTAFHGSWEKAIKEKMWAAHMVPLQKAIDDGFPVDIDYCFNIIAKADHRLFEQMFNCSFLDAILQYFQSAKIDASRTRKPIRATDDYTTYYAGLDIGREVDLSCLVVVSERYGRIRPVHVETMPRTDSEGLHAMVAWAFEHYNLRRLCVDSTGLGTFPADDMKKKHGDLRDVDWRRNKVEPIPFTQKSKEMLVTGMHAIMTADRLVLPDNDAQLPAFERRNFKLDTAKNENVEYGPRIIVNRGGTAELLRKELASIQRIVTKSANVIYDAPRTADGHADRAWGLLLAAHAVDRKKAMFAALQHRAGNTGAGDDDDDDREPN